MLNILFFLESETLAHLHILYPFKKDGSMTETTYRYLFYHPKTLL
jgi:hypothetical protein